MKKKHWLGVAALIILTIFWLTHSTNENVTSAASKKEIIIVEAKPFVSSLYYSGVIQPLAARAITSPADGVIDSMRFRYGDATKTGQLLFTISSEKFKTDYKTALTAYLKAKNDYSASENQLTEGKFLHSNQLISDDDFKTRQTNFYNAQLTLLQSKDALSVLMKQLDVKEKIDNLNITNIQQISDVMHADEQAQNIRIISPIDGIVLLPYKSDSSSAPKKIELGDAVKQGDVLGIIGNDHGLSIKINIDEFAINQIKVGQVVKVSGSAFPNEELTGKIVGVDHQALVNQNGVPNFSAEVVVDNLTPGQQKIIHFGMSAKVAINIETEPKIQIPLTAVTEQNGAAVVNVLAKNGKTIATPIKTGATSADEITVLQGLKVGDKIVSVN